MKVSILFFGATADAVGSRGISIEVGTGETLGDLIESLKKDHPALAQIKLLSAVNEEYSETTRTLIADDRVALFTPVSGG